MSDLKTKPTSISPMDFLKKIEDEQRRTDAIEILEMMSAITGEEPVMWGPAIIGYGSYHYKYESGREGDFFITGLSPRKQNLTLYLMTGFTKYEELMSRLGKHKTGKSCLYIKKLDDVDKEVLKELIRQSYTTFKNK